MDEAAVVAGINWHVAKRIKPAPAFHAAVAKILSALNTRPCWSQDTLEPSRTPLC